jgi:hypothetical protein
MSVIDPKSLEYMYSRKIIQPDTTFPEGFGKENERMDSMFHSARILGSLEFPDGFGDKALSLKSMFQNASLYGDIDLSKSTFPNVEPLGMFMMFHKTKFNGNLVYVANENVMQKLFEYGGIPAEHVCVSLNGVGREVSHDIRDLYDCLRLDDWTETYRFDFSNYSFTYDLDWSGESFKLDKIKLDGALSTFKFNGYYIWVANEEVRNRLILDGGADRRLIAVNTSF